VLRVARLEDHKFRIYLVCRIEILGSRKLGLGFRVGLRLLNHSFPGLSVVKNKKKFAVCGSGGGARRLEGWGSGCGVWVKHRFFLSGLLRFGPGGSWEIHGKRVYIQNFDAMEFVTQHVFTSNIEAFV